MQVSDGGSPPRSETRVVTVGVERNLNEPVFEPTSYAVKILETWDLGETVATVTARDSDIWVSVYDRRGIYTHRKFYS